jgi:outer membrane protein assembly factor BamA
MTALATFARLPLSVATSVLLLSISLDAGASDESADAFQTASVDVAGFLGASMAAMEQSDAVFGEITIVNGNVFDPAEPREAKALYRTANAIHKPTRPDVIRQQLLFTTGDAFSVRLLEESERILRSDPYIQDVRISPVRYANGKVDVRVSTKDAWTLRPSLMFGRSGGENDGGIGFDEINLFGSGVRFGTKYRSSVDRDSLSFQYHDRNLGNSWNQLHALYATNSDGYDRSLQLDRPFYALDSRAAGGVSVLQNDRIDSLYDRGALISKYRGQTNVYEAYGGWSHGISDGWVRRYTAGFTFEDHSFEAAFDDVPGTAIVPEDRTLAYPFIGVELLQDDFEKARNLEQINRTEDRHLGARLSLKLGFADSAFGADRRALVAAAAASRGFGSAEDHSLMLSANFSSRWEDAGTRNLKFGATVKYFNRQSDKRLFYAGLTGIYGHALDTDNLTQLGGDTGLRGYPLRYQAGDSSALLTIEQRYFTDWYPFQLFNVGGAVFADIGRTWGNNPVGDNNLGLQRDIGFGLRLGNTRSALGRVVHIDLAFPLDGAPGISNVQFLVGTKSSF